MIATILAHGIAGRSDLPLPAWQLAWAAGFSVAISFVALGMFWERPLLAAAARGRVLVSFAGGAGRLLEAVTRLIGLFLFGVVMFAAWRGNPNSAVNISVDALLVWFWVGLQFVSALLGDGWRAFNPYVTIADVGAWVRAKATGTGLSGRDHGDGDAWPAVVAIFSFVWFELAYHSVGEPRSIGVYLTAYSLAMVGGAAWKGRGWVRRADGFAFLFSRLAGIASFHVDEERRLRARPPLAGLARIPASPATTLFVVVVLGSTTFDGFSRNDVWRDIAADRVGWGATAVATAGLVAMILVVGLAYLLAINVMASITGDTAEDLSTFFGPTLIPIAAAYAVAHYFSFLVLTGQRMFIQISDPFGRGWDLFGTKDYAIDWLLVSTDTIAWVQTLAIAIGHVLAVAAAHDRAITRYEHGLAVRSQYPRRGVMIVYTVTGLFLLLGG